MNDKLDVSTAEWEVLRVVWSLDHATSRNVGDVLKETQDWELATTKTLLGRLVKKGYLKTEKDGNKFIYEATINESEGMHSRILELGDSFCAQSRGEAITSMIDSFALTHEDKQKILEALDKKEYSDSLSCSCISNCMCEVGSCKCGHHHIN